MSAIAPHITETDSLFAELDYRESDGIEVWLLWSRESDALTVYVSDARTGETFELAVRPENSREVFQHPYAYR